MALSIATGEVVWHFQTVHHDIWDFDVPSQPTLFEAEIEGREVKGLAQTTKQGYVFLLDRVTGEPLFPVEEVPMPQGPCRVTIRLPPSQSPPSLARYSICRAREILSGAWSLGTSGPAKIRSPIYGMKGRLPPLRWRVRCTCPAPSADKTGGGHRLIPVARN